MFHPAKCPSAKSFTEVNGRTERAFSGAQAHGYKPNSRAVVDTLDIHDIANIEL